ncbi:MAG TPA: rhomboid family intramembrane serine protease [Vicinamibacterales bacterium]|jgi:membrane associated rhomboid family serine protease|nr:rhomboid family intramembrane serine protease [Vicinamibacterales bacterium]
MPRPRTPVTTLLIVLNVLAFAYEVSRVGSGLLLGGGSLQALADAGALVPVFVRQNGEYWRVVTGAFLHGSVLHILVNMYSLYVLGQFVEVIAGKRDMTIIYVVSLLASGFAVVYLSSPYDVTVGASGAIFGLFGALFAIGFKLGRPGMQLVRANIGILVLNLFITFAVPGIAVWAHVGGLIAGFIVTYLIFTPPALRRAVVTRTASDPFVRDHDVIDVPRDLDR